MTGRGRDVAPRGQAGGVVRGPGRVDRGGLDHREDVVAVPFGRPERLYGKDETPLGAHVAVGVGVEGVAAAVGTDDAESVEGGAAAGRAQIGRAADQRLFAVALPDRVDRRVERRQRRRAGRRAGDRRPHQVQVIGDAVGQHRGVDAQDRELVGAEERPPVGGRCDLCADEDARRAVAEPVQIPPGVLAALPRAAEEHPDLRIHVRHLVARHAEEARVHPLLALVANQPLVRTPEATRPGEPADRLVAPAVAGSHRFANHLAVAEEAPEVVVRTDAAGHAVCISDDGCGVGGAHEAAPASARPARVHCRPDADG